MKPDVDVKEIVAQKDIRRLVQYPKTALADYICRTKVLPIMWDYLDKLLGKHLLEEYQKRSDQVDRLYKTMPLACKNRLTLHRAAKQDLPRLRRILKLQKRLALIAKQVYERTGHVI